MYDGNEVLELIKGRRSVRRYLNRPVEDEKLFKILEAARLSPSAGNAQNWKFIVVRDAEKIKRIASPEAGGQGFVAQAPAVLVACGTKPDEVMLCGQRRYSIDLSIATAYMILEAYQLGLGTCWLGHFNEEEVKKILDIPEHVRVVAVTPLGYTVEFPAPTPRKKLEDIVSYDKF